jgi:predicted ester cyclase
MSVEENKALIRQMYDYLKHGDITAYYELLSFDYHEHLLGQDLNLSQLQKWETEFAAAFTDMSVTLDDMIAEGDRVSVSVTWKATHVGEYMGFSPSGKQIVMHNSNIFKIASGKIAEGWNVMDVGFLQQLRSNATGENRTIEKNKATITYIWDELNKGNLAVIDECFADNFVRYSQNGKTMNRESYKNYICAPLIKGVPDIHFEVEDMVAEGDKVAFRFSFGGTNPGFWLSVPAGQRFSVTEVYFARFVNNKIVEFKNIIGSIGSAVKSG